MTKLMYCEFCHSIVQPDNKPRQPTFCSCKQHAVWWEDPRAGVLAVYYAGQMSLMVKRAAQLRTQVMYPTVPYVYVLGLHNGLLRFEGSSTKKKIEDELAATPDSYLFKTQNSLIIKIRPGESGDTGYAPLPDSDLEKEWLSNLETRKAERAAARAAQKDDDYDDD